MHSLVSALRLICLAHRTVRPRADSLPARLLLIAAGHPLMADMQVIVRLRNRGALRLDHLHDQALCEPEGRGDLSITT